MKKTEKIEVRLSPEEKAELAQVAEQDGQPVSEIVRSFINDHIAARQAVAPGTAKEKKMSMFQKMAWLGSGVIAGAGALAAITQSMTAPPAFSLEVSIRDNTGAQQRAYHVSSTIPASLDETAILRVPVDETMAYVVNVDLTPRDRNSATAAFRLCFDDGTQCSDLANPSIMAHTDRSAHVTFGAGTDREVHINLSPA